jgi:hypothetical protein
VDRAAVGEGPLRFSSGTDRTQAVSAPPNTTGLPDHLRAGVEHLSGLDLGDVKVHFNSSKPAGVDALAYTQGTQIHVAPGQERHLPHEAWHVAQQKQGRVRATREARGARLNDERGLESEADVMGARASSPTAWMREAGPSPEVTRQGRQGVSAEGPHASVTQRYAEEDPGDGSTWRVSEDQKAMLKITQREGGQTLFATEDLIDTANAKLKTAGQKGSFIRLAAAGATQTQNGQDLEQVVPKFVDASGAETFNTEMGEANKPGGADSSGDTQDWFKMYADCGRSSRTVMGSLGLGPKALYQAGTKSKETGRAFNPSKWTDKVYLEAMKAFVKDPANRRYLKAEHLKKRFGAYFRAEANKYEPKTPSSGKEAKEFAGYLDEDGQQAFAEYAKINVAVDPEIGEGYTMATGYDLPGFTGGDKAWNFHWAGVVMKAGSDNVTLENYAIMFNPTGDPVKDKQNARRAYDWTNTDWVFQMYGTVKKGQSFHEEHLASGTHGTKGTTFRVKI